MIQADEAEAPAVTPTDIDTEQQAFMAISQSTLTGTPAPRTVRFSGIVQGILVQMLLDCGNSSSFLNEALAAQL